MSFSDKDAVGGNRRTGRPRNQPLATNLAPREQILAIARQLFAERGLANVSMLEIAREAGLGQSSLYYWFRRKELIVAELVQEVNRLPLAYAEELAAQKLEPDVHMWRFVRFDVETVCAFPLEITEVHRLSGNDPDAFARYWTERRTLTAAVAAIVRRGIQSGIFRRVDAYLVALTTLAQDESVQNWYPSTVAASVPSDREPRAATYRATQIATFLADQAVRGLLVDPGRLEAIR
jgi:AcrR family transcriptional regulator